MDCFPAVSFSRDSKIDFSVNFTGPFKFDLNSIPDYRSDRSCKIESLPQEILIKCFSQAAQSPAQVCEWRTVSCHENFLFWKTALFNASFFRYRKQLDLLSLITWFGNRCILWHTHNRTRIWRSKIGSISSSADTKRGKKKRRVCTKNPPLLVRIQFLD